MALLIFFFICFFFFFSTETCHELVGDQEKGERNGEEGEEAMCEEEEVGEVVEVALAVLGLDAHRLHRKEGKRRNEKQIGEWDLRGPRHRPSLVLMPTTYTEKKKGRKKKRREADR
jgi:hypothetical protein